MAVDRVERLLMAVTEALNAAKIDYAVIGGNAVAAWIATVDEDAVRATKDVDLLVRRPDLPRLTEALRPVNLVPVEVLGVHMFVDREKPSPKSGAHLVFAGEKIRPEYHHSAPNPSQSRSFPRGVRVIDLPALVAMKLQAFRSIDRAHVEDLLAVGLIDENVRMSLPADLGERLRAIESSASG
jgi:hypothetical protein